MIGDALFWMVKTVQLQWQTGGFASACAMAVEAKNSKGCGSAKVFVFENWGLHGLRRAGMCILGVLWVAPEVITRVREGERGVSLPWCVFHIIVIRINIWHTVITIFAYSNIPRSSSIFIVLYDSINVSISLCVILRVLHSTIFYTNACESCAGSARYRWMAVVAHVGSLEMVAPPLWWLQKLHG